MINRILNSVDYRFWVILAFWLGIKIALIVGVLTVVAFGYLGIDSALLAVIFFLPMVIWVVAVARNLNSFSETVRRLLKLK